MSTPEELVPEILGSLPAMYGVLLLLVAGGATDDEVADRLGVPVEAIPSMTEVARSKLRRLLAASGGSG